MALKIKHLQKQKGSSRIPDSPLHIVNPFVARVLKDSDTMPLHKTDTHKPKRAGKRDVYTIPIIVPSDYDRQLYDQQTKDWYIFFRYRKKPGEKMHPVFKRVDLNSYKGRDKVRRAEQLRKLFEGGLKRGLNPFIDDIDSEDDNSFSYLKNKNIPEALQIIFDLEKAGWAKRTLSSYVSSKNVFLKFLASHSWNKKTIGEFNRSMAKMYSDYLLPKYDLTTHNNHMRYAYTFFGYFVEREILEINPFARIRKKRDGAGGHLPFNNEQIKKIKTHCRLNYPSALLFTEFTLETLMRSAELRKMKISDIDFEKGLVEIVNNRRAGRTTKDKQTRRIEISKPLLQKMKVHCAGFPLDYLVFRRGFRPFDFNAHRHKGWRSDISKDYTDILRGLGFGPAYTLYSLRHSGAAIKAGEGVSIYKLMQILGHSSIGVTEIYLRGLGLYL